MNRPSFRTRSVLFRSLFIVALCVGLAAAPAVAQRAQRGAAPAEAAGGPGLLAMLPADSVTSHTLTAGGETLNYTARAGSFRLYDQSGEPTAAIVYTAYTRDGVDPATRPLTFVFNGGPGAASTYLHLGLVGPKAIDFGPARDGADASLRDNPDSWLAFTDLVLVDPVGTGWSRAAKADKAGEFWSVGADASSLAKVMALYVGQNARSASPKFLLGESYGGFRAAKVARAAQREQGMVVSGILMLSPFLEGALTGGATRFALGAALQLPSLAAAELDRRGAFTPEALAEAERFAMTEYLTTLAGKPPEGEAARAFYQRVATLTGVPVEAVARGRGFVRNYSKQVMGDRSAVVSPYDATSAAADPFPELETDAGADHVLDGYLQALGGTFAGYARDTLGFRTEMTYHLLNREIAGKWDWQGGRGQASVTRDMRELLALNPRLRMLIVHGRSDVVTPYGVTRHLLDRLPPIGDANRTALKLYRGGHMFYLDTEERAAFTRDARAFYRGDGG